MLYCQVFNGIVLLPVHLSFNFDRRIYCTFCPIKPKLRLLRIPEVRAGSLTQKRFSVATF